MFNLGNIITILVVLIVLAIYRIIDKDNRALEKVKKYADKLRDDMSNYADQRSEDLKAYAIDLQVQQKAAVEVLRRVQTAEEALSANAGQIGGIATRISEYDRALAELKDMSSRVDQNLAVIHDESAFVDNVARTLKATKEEIDKLKNSIPEMRGALAGEAEALLSDMKSLIDSNMQTHSQAVSSMLAEFKERAHADNAAAAQISAKTIRAAEERYNAVEAELAAAFKRAHAAAEKLEDASFIKLRDQINERADKLGEAVETRFNGLRDQAKEKIAETQTLIKNFKSDWRNDADETLSAAKRDSEAMAEKIESRLNEINQQLTKAETAYNERCTKIDSKISETASALQSKAREQLKAYQDELASKQNALRLALKNGIDETKTQTDAAVKNLRDTFASFKFEVNETVATQKTRLEALNAELSSIQKKSDGVIEALNEKFTERSSDLESRVLEGFEARASELRGIVESGLGRLENMRLDADRMESALRDVMIGVERRVEEDFALFGQGLTARQNAFEEDFKLEAARVKTAVKDIDAELNVLKSKAYNDVSEKLKVFEDEFFADLRARSDEANAKLAEWRSEVDERLAAAVRDAETAHSEKELEWTNAARATLADAQNKVQEQLEKITAQLEVHRSSIGERIGESGEALASLKASVTTDLNEARAAADAYIRAELERWKHDTSEHVKESEKQALADKSALDASLDSARSRFEDAEAALAKESAQFAKKFAEAMKQSESERVAALTQLEASFKSDVRALAETWDKERRKVIESAKEERDTLMRDVRTLSDDVERLRQELSQKSAQALDDFTKSYEKLHQETARKSNEALSSMTTVIDDYKKQTAELHKGFDSAKTQINAAVEEQRKNNARVFLDMDKEIKTFQAQTKLFERADSLKEKLAENIAGMKADLSLIESRRAEMAELETQYSRIKRLEDELGQKIARFLAEKRRLDTMEDDFKRLITMSQGVDQKLAAVTSSNDQVTQMQAEFRRLSDMAGEAMEKYERVEKKSDILVTTADAIDKNFEAIHDIERDIHTLDSDMRSIPNQIAELKKYVDDVMTFKPTLDATVSRLDEMGDVLSDAEKRAEELQKAREWLARAETRFDELNKKTESHLRLLNDLLKDDPSKARKDKGAPSIETQEAVRKLAHQGWKIEEIAKALKISRGEAELILEMSESK